VRGVTGRDAREQLRERRFRGTKLPYQARRGFPFRASQLC